ncbi:MAG: tRNA (adenosine(37)-N6)-threonylcarbamoyltransferase complex ATPase subunit type 1 TsaE [Chloroflexi bacterium]|nr:tRNA (adenosine(37)-N6)-threonylcarbamoyltransferase complex ATPase subunit type 1 TsaE [Chloroflexota bacterium]
MTLTLETSSPEQTAAVGIALGRLVQPGDVLLLQGPLGAGKTQLTQGLAQGVGIPEEVTSPTFILVNEYRTGRLPLYHVDLYRIERVEEATDLGLDEYFFGPGVTVVEWADRAPAAMPDEHLLVELRYVSGQETDRRLRLTPRGERYEQLLAALKAAIPAALVASG